MSDIIHIYPDDPLDQDAVYKCLAQVMVEICNAVYGKITTSI
jgi:hypothetical protein